MDSLGLMFYQSRFYDPSLGRFISPDIIVPTGTQGTQAWNRYAYVNNNPVRYTDPSGHQAWQGDGGNYTWRDKAHDEYVRQRNDALKCQGGKDTYCSYGELHPL